MAPPLLDLTDTTEAMDLMDTPPVGPHIVLLGLVPCADGQPAIADATQTQTQIANFIMVIDHRNLIDATDRRPIEWHHLKALFYFLARGRDPDRVRAPWQRWDHPPFLVVTTDGDTATRIEYYEDHYGHYGLYADLRVDALLDADLRPTWPTLAAEAA